MANFSRWSVWLKATHYHATFASLYASFFKTEANASKHDNVLRLSTIFQETE